MTGLSLRGMAAQMLAMLLPVAGPLPAADLGPAPATWPAQRGGPGGAAAASCPDLRAELREWTFRGRPKQVYASGVPVWASPAFAAVGGRPFVFVGGADQTLYALDIGSRRRVWSKVTNGSIIDAPAVAVVRGQQVVFWGAADRFIYAHAAADGQMLWTRELVPPTNTQAEARIPSPFFDGGVLYVACFIYDKALSRNRQEAWLFALDAGTGRELWRRELAGGPVTAPNGLRLDGRLHLYVAAQKGILQAFQVGPEGAEPAWCFQMPHAVMGSPALLAGDAPKVFLGSKFGDVMCLDARTGAKLWHRMTGNWIDNNPCCAELDGRPTLFVGSNDYHLYALRADDGSVLWRRPLGGEIYSAPTFFLRDRRPCVAAACLDDHLYVVDAGTGEIVTSFASGSPTWDKIPKGETLWGSPVAVSVAGGTALVHGSYDGAVYLLPLEGENRFVAPVRGNVALWIGLAVVGLAFSGFVLPGILFSGAQNTRPEAR